MVRAVREERSRREEEADTVEANFQVAIRVRPPLERERSVVGFQEVAVVEERTRLTLQEIVADPAGSASPSLCTNHVFTFDQVYGPEDAQVDVYARTARPAVQSCVDGYNATILAYGQTGTGKTYTMTGDPARRYDENRGIVPRCMEEIFQCIERCPNRHDRFLVRAAYLQIYNEQLSDLLKPSSSVALSIREDRERGVYVQSLSEWIVRSPAEVATLMERGNAARRTAHTTLNDVSSRSHSVFIVVVEHAEEDEHGQEMVRVGKLNLVDLAGSERVRLTGAKGVRLEESKKINQSLSALGNVIAALTDNRGRAHIPYRDSKLTRLLEDSLGGNCKTTMIAMVSPALEAFGESLSTLRFAHRAKQIRNHAHVNADVDATTLLRRYEAELAKLRAELRSATARREDVVDKRQLLEVDAQRRRAEQDKAMALSALEERERDFSREKEAVRRLEERIRRMSADMLQPAEGADAEERRTGLESSKLEEQRLAIEEEKLQVDRYKQLMIKQRDIMMALTHRLNERDETILALQAEVETLTRAEKRTAVDTGSDLGLGGRDRQYMPEDPQSPTASAMSADEKVEELRRIVDAQRQELHRQALEVEDLTADKRSLECLLRQNVEHLVTHELDQRMGPAWRPGPETLDRLVDPEQDLPFALEPASTRRAPSRERRRSRERSAETWREGPLRAERDEQARRRDLDDVARSAETLVARRKQELRRQSL